MRYSTCDESMRLIYITYICIHGEGTKFIPNMHMSTYTCEHISIDTHIELAPNACTQYIYTHTSTHMLDINFASYL